MVFCDCCKHNLSLCEAFLKYCHCGVFSIFCYKLCEIVEALICAWLTQSLKHFECELPIKVLKLSPISPKMDCSLQVEFQSCDTLLLHSPKCHFHKSYSTMPIHNPSMWCLCQVKASIRLWATMWNSMSLRLWNVTIIFTTKQITTISKEYAIWSWTKWFM